jgi:glycosyltransferase involved in cell wall biosynthesis
MEEDRIMNFISQAGFTNRASEKLNIIFIPCYLDGNDGIFNLPYYDLLTGMDATVFPSYYEPWGYTPMESIAFGIPTITTDLAGFGLWAKNHIHGDTVEDGAVVIRRTDSNYHEVVGTISGRLLALIRKEKAERSNIRKHCMDLASKAEWKLFIAHYLTAYDIALANAAGRIKNAVNV